MEEEKEDELLKRTKDTLSQQKGASEEDHEEEDLDTFLKRVKKSSDVAERKEEVKERLRQSILSHMISDDVDFELEWF